MKNKFLVISGVALASFLLLKAGEAIVKAISDSVTIATTEPDIPSNDEIFV
jgi:hypothetical protein